MNLPALYARDQKGRTKIWQVSTSGNKISVSYGLLDGKRSTKTTVVKNGKNLGKINETSPEEQAGLEAESKWRKKVNREFFTEDIDSWVETFGGMLAKDVWKAMSGFVDSVGPLTTWNFKIDGVRTYMEEAGVHLSKRRTVYKMANDSLTAEMVILQGRLKAILRNDVILDSEFYIHGMPLQHIQSCVKKENDNTKDLTAVVLDFYCPNIPNLTNGEREHCLRAAQMDDLPLVIYNEPFTLSVPPGVSLEEHLSDLIDMAENKGYEGIMIRNDVPYQVDARNSALWKAKKFNDDEFKILGIVESKPYTHNDEAPVRQGKFLCDAGNGKTFECRPTGDVDFRRHILEDDVNYVGMWLNVKFQGKTEDGVPVFPTGQYIREITDISEVK